MNLKTKNGLKWSGRDIARVLGNHSYIGKIKYGGQIYDGLHEAIISHELWEAARTVDDAKPKNARRPPETYKHWLSGILKCAYCGSSLCHFTSRGNRFFRCGGNSNGICKHSNLLAVSKLEILFKAALDDLLSNANENEYLAERGKNSEHRVLEASLAKIRSRLVRHIAAYSSGIDSLEEYGENKKNCLAQESEILKRLDAADSTQTISEPTEKIAAFELPGLLFSSHYSVAQKSAAIRNIIQKVAVDKDNLEIIIYYFL